MKKILIPIAVSVLLLTGCGASPEPVYPAEDETPPTPEEILQSDADYRSWLHVVNVQLTDGSTIDCVVTEGAVTCLEFTREFSSGVNE